MSDDSCQHAWGPAEQVESAILGEIHSPLCRHCGAVKLEEEQRASKRRQAEIAARPVNFPAPIQTNIPPAGSPVVHPYQSEFATDV